jgi:hypothetical protein
MRVARSVFQLHAAGTSLAPSSAPKLASNSTDYTKEMRATEWGCVVNLHGNNGDARMSSPDEQACCYQAQRTVPVPV